MTTYEDLLEKAKKIYENCTDWKQFSNAIFDYNNGILAPALTTAEERKNFLLSKEYREIRTMLHNLM